MIVMLPFIGPLGSVTWIRHRVSDAYSRLAAPGSSRPLIARDPGFAGAPPLLLHGPRRELLGFLLVLAALEEALLDVLVLSFALLAPRPSRHLRSLGSTALGGCLSTPALP